MNSFKIEVIMYMSTYLTNVVFEAVPHNFELIFGDDVVFEVVDGEKVPVVKLSDWWQRKC